MESSSNAGKNKPQKQKWGSYAKDLKWDKQTVTFHQNVPAGATTIKACLKSRNILDAVFHKDKAFWVANPKKYALANNSGMVCMRYTFTPEGAKSLMEDKLICGSGDFDDDNPEEWKGETKHPKYTIWKTNEIGAYGIGQERLQELAPNIVNIEAYDNKGNRIKL
jgi:hypothetical protein